MKNMKQIPGYSNYLATKDGRVWTNNLRKGFMSTTTDKSGYVRFHLIGDDGKRRGIYAHRVVAMTYLSNLENKPEVNHLDHDKNNNCLDNLSWCTHQENIEHDWAKGKRQILRGEQLRKNKTTEDMATRIRTLHADGLTQVKLSKMFGISQPTVSQIVLRKTWRHI